MHFRKCEVLVRGLCSTHSSMEKLGLLCSLTLLVSWIIAPAVGQTGTQEDKFLNDKERKVRLLARHALFLQLAAEATDCGNYILMLSKEFKRLFLFLGMETYVLQILTVLLVY